MSESGLKDCPFCGSEAEMFKGGRRTTGHGETCEYIGVRCTSCKVEKSSFDYTNKDNLGRLISCIEAWNARPPSDPASHLSTPQD